MYHVYNSSIFVLIAKFPFVFKLLVVHLNCLNFRVKLTFYLMFIAQRGKGVLRISSDRDDGMGAKIKTQKNPVPHFRTIKISRKQRQSQNKFGCTLFAELRGRA